MTPMINQTLEEPENRQQRVLRQVCLLTLIGFALFAIVLFTPDADPGQGAFFQAALQTTWRHTLDLAAAWSSIKIIVFSVGLFLVIESAGTLLAVLKFRSLALFVFFLQVAPCVGLLCGCYYLAKSLL